MGQHDDERTGTPRTRWAGPAPATWGGEEPVALARALPEAGAVTPNELAADYRRLRGLRANMIASVDGAAALGGVSAGLGTPVDQWHMDVLRRVADVVLVGSGTLREEEYGPLRVGKHSVAWRRAAGLPDHPVLAVVSARLSVGPDAPFLAPAEGVPRPLVVTRPPRAGEDATRWAARRAGLAERADVLVAEGMVDALAQLTARGLGHQLSEGGPSVLARLLAEDALDELCLTVSPQLVGAGAGRIVAPPPGEDGGGRDEREPRPMRLRQVLVEGSFLLTRWERAR